MNKHDELSGTFVLVHPDLVYDPEERKNRIGIIASAELENDNVMVSFGKESQSLFSANALLVLRRHNDISFDAMRDHHQISAEDFKDLLKISLLANSSLTKDHRQAIEIARENRTALEYSMASLEEGLGLKQDYSIER